MRGYRNTAIALAYLALCALFAHIAGREHIAEIATPCTGIGFSVMGIIGARAANKYAEKKNGGLE